MTIVGAADGGGQWVYAPRSCVSGGLDCVFAHWSNCSTGLGSVGGQRQGGEGSVLNTFTMPHTIVEHFEWVPAAFRKHGLYFWRAMTTGYVMRLSAEVEAALLAQVDALRAEMGWGADDRVIGLHVRHGDSCRTNIRRNKCVALERHVAEVRTVAALYGISKVFVATDDAGVVGRLRRELGPAFHVMVVSMYDRAMFESGDGVYIERRLALAHSGCPPHSSGQGSPDGPGGGCLDREAVLNFTLIDLVLLSHAHALVGHLTSNMSRMAHLLMTLRHQGIMPFVSVDGPFCHHWQACCGTRRDGSSRLCPFVEH
jgi:hypothetical protein